MGMQTSEEEWNYLPHLAPEALRSDRPVSDVALDVYALGMTSYRLLNGEIVFENSLREVGDVTEAIRLGEFPQRNRWLPHVHQRLRRVVLKAINRDPAKRFAGAAEYRHALERARPAVSWYLSQSAGAMSWRGTAADGGRVWEAHLSRNGSQYEFIVTRGPQLGSMRRVNSLAYSGPSLNAAYETASRNLESIAEGKVS